MKFPRVTLLLSSLLSLILISLSQAQAIEPDQAEPDQAEPVQPTASERTSLDSILQFTPPPLPSRGRPTGRQRGGASRGNCEIAGQLPLTAIVPASPLEKDTENDAAAEENSTQLVSEMVFSLTAQPRPSFWFYVPYPLETTPLEFVLQDDSNNTLYQGTVSRNLTGNPLTANPSSSGSIIQVLLPETAPALEPDTLYHWFLVAYCDDTNPAFVEGWVAQQTLTEALSAALNGATPREQAALYAQNGLWQDLVTLLGEQYRLNPEDSTVADDWKRLLEAADLGELSNQPMSDCCIFR